MFCNTCGAQLEEGAKFCTACGATLEAAPDPTPELPLTQPYVAPAPPRPSKEKEVTPDMLPEEYRPLSAWAYFGYQMLFAIPIVGLVFLIIFTFKRSNYNRRAFARSYWVALLFAGILTLTIHVVLAIFGISAFA